MGLVLLKVCRTFCIKSLNRLKQFFIWLVITFRLRMSQIFTFINAQYRRYIIISASIHHYITFKPFLRHRLWVIIYANIRLRRHYYKRIRLISANATWVLILDCWTYKSLELLMFLLSDSFFLNTSFIASRSLRM